MIAESIWVADRVLAKEELVTCFEFTDDFPAKYYF